MPVGHRPAHRVRRSLPEWRALGASAWVLDTIAHGVKIPWTGRPPPRRARPYPASTADSAFMAGEIQRQLDLAYVQEVTDPGEQRHIKVLSPAFVVRSSSGAERTVIDYRYPNSFMAQRTCRYETVADLAQVLRPADAMLVWDVADAYHHLLLRPEDSLYLAFELDGRIFIPLTMPFGLRVAPYTWTKVCRPVVQCLRGKGFRMIAYVDDSGGAPPAKRGQPASQTEAIDAFRTVERLFRRLGLRVHPNKGVRTGPTAIRLLGHTVDSKRRLFLLLPDRAIAVEQTASAILRWATSHRRHVKFSPLRSFLGKAVSTHLSVPTARFHLAALYAALNGRMTGDVILTHQCLRDLSWWSELRQHASTGRAIWPAPPTITMETDASTVGWGAVFNGVVPARGFHGPHRRTLHINPLELGAVRLGLQSFRALMADRETIIRLKMDSTVAIGVINNGTSSSPTMMAELRRLHALTEAMGVVLRPEHLPSALNLWADRLSRERDSTDWTLSCPGFMRLEAKYGPHTLDLFATDLTTRCGRFFSRVATPNSSGVNAMAHDWTADNCWANPRFNLVGPVVQRIIQTAARVTLVAPHWEAQPWWAPAVEACAEFSFLPLEEGVYTHGAADRPSPRPWWRTVAFRFDGNAASTTPPALPNSKRC